MRAILFLTLLCVALSTAEIFFSEEFNEGWDKRWVISNNKVKEGTAGEFKVTAGKYFNDAEADKGLQTGQDARFYQISAEFPKEFSNKGKTLVFQFSVKHQQEIDCGGGYFKILPAGLDQANFNGDSPYNIMFGPDICGHTKRTHVIFNYKGKNHLLKNDIPCLADEFSHVYSLYVFPNNTFSVLIDGKEEKTENLVDNWDFLPPKQILDPNVSKPADWVDEKEITDPEDKKPEGYDDIPKQIRDPDANKPEDWDTELDGEWEAPLIENPAYKGEWKAKKIPNPKFKGEWVHPKIDNPEYKDDPEIYAFNSNKFIGLEIWQVKAGTIFDNILITDDIEVAKEWAKKTEKTREAEKAAHEKDEAERAKLEAEKPKPEAGDAEHEYHDDHEHDEL